MTRRILVVFAILWASLNLISCGGSSSGVPSGLPNRVLVSQGVSSATLFGGLVTVNGFNDTLTSVPELSAGSNPGLMAISPARNIVAAFDPGSNSVFAADTTKETSLGQVHLPGPTFSMSVPTSSPVGYAAVATAIVPGFPVLGAVEVMNLSAGSITSTIAVTNAQVVIPNEDGSQLLVFSNGPNPLISNTLTVLTPARALPGVDLSCTPAHANPSVCTSVSGFDQPVFAIVNQTKAYVLNCGAECGGTQASVQVVDLSTTPPTLVGAPVKVNGATYALLSGTNLYVAGNGTPTGPLCTSLPNAAKTAATFCGTLDIVDLTTMTDPFFNNPAAEIAITDGYHDHMDMSINGHLFVGSHDCQDIGNVNNPSGEVRGCLAIYNTTTGAVVFPPDNGDVNGLQSFTSRKIEYVAEGGFLRVYDTTKDILLINAFLPVGTISVVGYVGDVKAIDFF